MKANIGKLSLAALAAALFVVSCAQVIGRMRGVVGQGASAATVNVGFTDFTGIVSGSEGSAKLNIALTNAGGEYAEFGISPANPSGTTPSQQFGTGDYGIDGSANTFTGGAMVGDSILTIEGTSGVFRIDSISFSGSTVSSVQAMFNVTGTGGTWAEGSFVYGTQAPQ